MQTIKGNKKIRLLGVIMALTMVFSMNTMSAFAAEAVPKENVVTVTEGDMVQPYGTLSGYGSGTVTKSNGLTTFNVSVSGNYSTAAGMTLKTTGNADAYGYITVYKPDGSVYKNQVYMTGSEERFFQLYFVNGGTYKVKVDFYVPSGSVTTECWIYA